MLNASSAIVIDCTFNSATSYAILGHPYQCIVQNRLSMIFQEDLIIEAATGTHVNLKSHDDVISIQINNKGVQFIPKEMEKVFVNLKSIFIYISNIQEIRPNLIYFEISNSDLWFIEDGTFDFNPNLEAIWLPNNKIFHFDANVFKNLHKISWLGLSSNSCGNKNIQGSLDNAKALIDSIKANCFDGDFHSFKNSLKILENEEEILKLESFEKWFKKFKNLKKFFNNSKFSHVTLFETKLEHKLEFLMIKFFNEANQFSQNQTYMPYESQSLADDKKNLSMVLKKIDEKLTNLYEKIDNFNEQIDDLRNIPAIISKRLHKVELEQKEIKSKIQSLERKIVEKTVRND